MAIPKPKHLGTEYADQFKDRSVADAYVNYPPYAAEVFQVLDGLIQDEPRIVLDVGCGTGDVARPLATFVERVDAVDPSAAMIEVGRSRDGGDRPNVRWVCQTAEEFAYDTRYSLIVAGASLHWMDWYKVIPRMAGALSRRGYLAIVGGRGIDTAPWVNDLNTDHSRNTRRTRTSRHTTCSTSLNAGSSLRSSAGIVQRLRSIV